MEYGASAEDVARVCHAHPVREMCNFLRDIHMNLNILIRSHAHTYRIFRICSLCRRVLRHSERLILRRIAASQLISKSNKIDALSASYEMRKRAKQNNNIQMQNLAVCVTYILNESDRAK